MKYIFFIPVLLLGAVTNAQDLSSIKFGKVTEADLSRRNYPDTSAGAVVIADIGFTQVKGNDNSSVSLEYKYFRRVHVLKSTAYDDLGTVEIPIRRSGDMEDKLSDLKAVTYNLENGKVVESKLVAKTSLFKGESNKYGMIQKFAFPNVKEGSIIEYEYKITSEFLSFPRPWDFQSEYPHLWSSYTISLPQFLDYIMIAQGDIPYFQQDRKDKQGNYGISVTKEIYGGKTETERFDVSCAVSDFKWVMKDVPAFKEEPFTSSSRNYISRLDFQLAGLRPPYVEKQIMTTWPDMAQKMLSDPDFGGQLANSELWTQDMLKPLKEGVYNKTDLAKKIYSYIRDNFTCTRYSQLFVDEPLTKVATRKKGGVAEINLLLIALLRNAGIYAEPVLLSTKRHGFVSDEYPVRKSFNYVICKTNIDGKDYLLDASHPRLGFGKLYHDIYNGSARVMNSTATLLSLTADQIRDDLQTTILASKEPNGKWKASANKVFGYYTSEYLRNKLITEQVSNVGSLIFSDQSPDLKISNIKVDSLKAYDSPLSVQFEISNDTEGGDMIYMNPVMGARFSKNPFESPDRRYPVEMPYKISELYTINLQVPDGYVVEEMPKPLRLITNEKNECVFEYLTTQSGENITVSYKLNLNKVVFFQDEYPGLREFFSKMVAKLNEQIVFKKKP